MDRCFTWNSSGLIGAFNNQNEVERSDLFVGPVDTQLAAVEVSSVQDVDGILQFECLYNCLILQVIVEFT